MPRKTDLTKPADWIFIADSDLGMIRLSARQEVAFHGCRSKLAEVIEKLLKAELIRSGWFLKKTHDLIELGEELARRSPDLLLIARPLCGAFAQVYFTDRYPGFDLEDPDWPAFRAHLAEVEHPLATIRVRVG